MEVSKDPKVNVIIQEFVSSSKGKDVRVFAIGGRATGAMLRKARRGTFKANFSAGGKVSPFDLNPAVEWLAVESARLIGLDIAGVDIPVFQNIEFEESPYDLFVLPLWVDEAIEKVKELGTLDAEISVLEKQAELLGEELRITSQRVNLFEKVKIPETREHIRMIHIYLGDEQTAAVVRGKIAKKKLVRVNL